MKANKHRAWDTVNNCFARIATYIDSEGNFYADCDPHGVDMSGKRTIGFRQQYVFGGMFTGLVDKNGKEIYEGDILNSKEGSPLLVSWNKRFASFCLDKKGWLHSHWFGESTDPEDCEVIGNIYETPELITEK